MIDNHFRAILPGFTHWLIRIYHVLRLSPNQITFLALLTSVAATCLVATHQFLPAIGVWWLGRLFDGTDGLYARSIGQTSDFGAHLDILFDMASYALMIVGFSTVFPSYYFQWVSILFLYILCITGALALGNLEKIKTTAVRDNRGLHLAAGLAEGGETGIAYTLFLLFPSSIGILSSVWIIVLASTVVGRIILAKKELC